MMTKKSLLNLFFLSFFLILLSFSVYAVPSQIASINWVELDEGGDTVALRLDDFFQEFDGVNISWLNYPSIIPGVVDPDSIYIVDGGTQWANWEEPQFMNITLNSTYGTPGEAWLIFTSWNNEFTYSDFFVNISVSNTSDGSYAWREIGVSEGSMENPEQVASIPQHYISPGDYFYFYPHNYEQYFHNLDYCYSIPTLNVSDCMTIDDYTTVLLQDRIYPVNITLQRLPDSSLRVTHAFDGNYTGGPFTVHGYYIANNGLTTVDDISTSFIVNYLSTSSNTDAPSQIASMLPPNLYYDETVPYFMNNYFNNYNTITFSWEDNVLNQTVSLSRTKGNVSSSCVDGEFELCLFSTYSNIQADFTSNGLNVSKNVVVTATNGYGDSSFNTVVTSSSDSEASASGGGIGDLNDQTSFIGALSVMLNGVFPDKDDLTTRFKFAYVFIAFLLTNGLILFLSFSSGANMKFVGYVLLFIDVALFFYFISIGYVPAVVIVLGVLMLLAIAYFKVMGGS